MLTLPVLAYATNSRPIRVTPMAAKAVRYSQPDS